MNGKELLLIDTRLRLVAKNRVRMAQLRQRDRRSSNIGVGDRMVAVMRVKHVKLREIAWIVAHDEGLPRLSDRGKNIRPMANPLKEKPIPPEPAACHGQKANDEARRVGGKPGNHAACEALLPCSCRGRPQHAVHVVMVRTCDVEPESFGEFGKRELRFILRVVAGALYWGAIRTSGPIRAVIARSVGKPLASIASVSQGRPIERRCLESRIITSASVCDRPGSPFSGDHLVDSRLKSGILLGARSVPSRT